MLQIDFGNILSKITPDITTKSVTKKKKKASSTKVKDEIAYATLGDFNRISHLPDIVTEEFVSMYSDTLEELLQPYVSSRLLTIGYASRYRQALLENIFGSESHLGIFHYLKERDLDKKTDKEIVLYSEQMILKGWQIRKEANQYWLVNSDLQRVIEMTGRAPMFKELAALSFDDSSAHVFLEDSVASKMSALAKTLGHDADELAATGNLDILLARVSDSKFSGYVINYNAMRRILKKPAKYTTSVDGISMVDIYNEGYRLSSQLSFPFSEKAILTKGDRLYSVKSVEDDVNKTHFVNRFLLSAVAAKVKKDILSGTGIIFPEVIEIKDFRNTIALMTELYPSEFFDSSFSDTLDVLEGVFSSSRQLDKIITNVATLAIIDGVLLGNQWFSPACFSIDSVSGKVFSKHSLDYFTAKAVDLPILSDSKSPLSRDVFNYFFLSDTARPDVLSTLMASVPSSIKSKIASYNLDLSEYPYKLSGVQGYFEKAKEVIVNA